jgi:hypothetical protein
MLRIGDRPQPWDVELIGWRIDGGGPPLTEGFVGPLLVEGMPEGIEAPLLGAEGGGRGRVVSALRSLCIRSCRPF